MAKIAFVFFSSIFFFSKSPLFGQGGGIIKGTVVDSLTKKELPFATVSIYYSNSHSNNLLIYQLTDSKGRFEMSKIPLHTPLNIAITFIGYKTFQQTFEFSEKQLTIDLYAIPLIPEPTTLKDISVFATKALIVLKKDTIQYNADAIMLPPNSLLEDLLRKLPGMQVDRDGSIYFNGRVINRITVDGKNYFGNDTKVASQNLPASIIENIQALIDKEELEKNSNTAVSELPTTLNLILKKEAKQSWLGKLYSGIGTSTKYEMGGITNRFKDTTQISILFLRNNINKTGFTFKNSQDINSSVRGGNNSTDYSSLAMFLDPRVLPFFSSNIGQSETTGMGFNFNVSPNSKKGFSIQYFYGLKRSNIENILLSKQFINDTLNARNSFYNNYNYSASHNVGITSKIINPKSDINMKINYSYTNADQNGLSQTQLSNNFIGHFGKGNGVSIGKTGLNEYSQELILSKKFSINKKKKLIFLNTLNVKNGDQNQFANFTTYYSIPYNDTAKFNQFKTQKISTVNVLTSLNYYQPLGSKLMLNINSKIENITEFQGIKTYNRRFNSSYDSLNPNLSSNLNRNLTNLQSLISLDLTKGRSKVTVGTVILNQFSELTQNSNGDNIKSSISKMFPTFRYNFDQFAFSFNTQLIPVPVAYLNETSDSSSQYSIFYGNKYLLPSLQYKYSIGYFKFNTKKNYNYNWFINLTQIDNDIIFKKIIDAHNIQLAKPINSNGSLYLSTTSTFRKDIRNRPSFQYSYKVGVSLSYSKKEVIVNSIKTKEENLGFSSNIAFSVSSQDKFEITSDYQFKITGIRYGIPLLKNPKIVEHLVENNIIYFVSKRLFFETGLTLKSYRQNRETNDNFFRILLNASTSYFLFKQNAQIKLLIYDLLNSNKEINYYTSQLSYFENQTNVLRRYAMLSFIYNFKMSRK